MIRFRYLGLSLFCILLTGCFGTTHHFVEQDGAPDYTVDVSQIPDAKPKAEPLCRYGNPEFYYANGHTYKVLKNSKNYDERGIASWYGTKFHKKLTSSREPYDMLTMTAAHKTLPLPTYVRVTNLANRKQVVVKVNDRGPFHDNRIIDLSFAAAKKLGIYPAGTGLVQVTAINPLAKEALVPDLPAHKDLKLFLQIGAFSNRDNAEMLIEHINNLVNTQVAIKEGVLHDQSIYRVLIGPLPDVNHSDEIHQKLAQAGLDNAMTVIE